MRVVLVLLTVLASAPLAAQDQSHIDAAKELLDLMNADQSIEQAYEQIYPHMQAMADQLGVTDAQRPIFDRYVEKMVAVMKEELSWEKMEPLMLNAYVDVYSEEELRELNEFYASPLGQKFIAKMPELMDATMRMTQDMMQAFIPRMQKIQQELQAELAKQRAEQQE
jgi:hypothetical protein